MRQIVNIFIVDNIGKNLKDKTLTALKENIFRKILAVKCHRYLQNLVYKEDAASNVLSKILK
jgi:hypothetical protein